MNSLGVSGGLITGTGALEVFGVAKMREDAS